MNTSNNHEIIMTFRGSKQAIAAEKVLLDAEVLVRVMPLPSLIAEGCGVCLRVQNPDLLKAKEILNQKGISYKDLWLKQGNGSYSKLNN